MTSVARKSNWNEENVNYREEGIFSRMFDVEFLMFDWVFGNSEAPWNGYNF